MKTTSLRGICIATAVFMMLYASLAAAQEQPPQYVSVDCMQSTSPDYADIETELWQPMHQRRVNQGKISSWALYRVLYGDRATCDFYTVTIFTGAEQLNTDPAFEEVFAAVYPDRNLKQAMASTWEARKHMATHLWLMVDHIAVTNHRYAVVNKMYARDPDMYERMETRVFKPGHQALIDDGHRSGWGMYELVAPLGSSIPYNYKTVDFMNDLNPVPMAEALMTAHPDRDLDALEDLLQLRDQVSSETWVLVAATEEISEGEKE